MIQNNAELGLERLCVSQLERTILEKLFVDRFIGGRHTSVDNVPKGFPKHLRGDVKAALKQLNRHGYLILKHTGYGLEVSLRPDKIEEIKSLFKRA